ncbi:MAG: hypothetical protein HY268_20925 [Deltaproteobacteria bacterium]|nr:hypothetical protein [Deltaproteobacteria bacterium]
MSLGLSAISSAYRFSEKDESAIAEVFNTLRQSIWKRFQSQLNEDPKIPAVTDIASLDEWITTVQHTFDAIEQNILFEPDDRTRIRAEAWQLWLTRIEYYWANGGRKEPELDDILAAAAGMLSASLFKFHLAEMTLVDWSTALFAALRDVPPDDRLYCPIWVAVVALHALGFRSSNWSVLTEWLGRQKFFSLRPYSDLSITVDSQWSWLHTDGPSRSVVIVKRSEQSMVASWRPSSAGAAIAFTTEQVLRLMERLSSLVPPPPIGLIPSFVVFEMPPEKADSDKDVLKVLSQKLTQRPTVDLPPAYLYEQRPQGKASEPYALGSRNIDDLLSALEPQK